MNIPPKSKLGVTCRSCFHWYPIGISDPSTGKSIGVCKAKAPAPSDTWYEIRWPRTPEDQFCGEFKLDSCL